MPPFMVRYEPGTYDQSNLEVRKRLKDEDVGQFIRYWMQGRVPAWIGQAFTSPRGNTLSAKMVRSHAVRLEREGLIPAPDGTLQPHWTTWTRPAGMAPGEDGPPVVTAGGVSYPGSGRSAVRENRGGRPRRDMVAPEGITAAPRQYPGMTAAQAAAARRADEERDRLAAAAEIAREREDDPEALALAEAVRAELEAARVAAARELATARNRPRRGRRKGKEGTGNG